MSKPWLEAETASEAFNIAHREWWRGNPRTGYADALSEAVIEWAYAKEDREFEQYLIDHPLTLEDQEPVAVMFLGHVLHFDDLIKLGDRAYGAEPFVDPLFRNQLVRVGDMLHYLTEYAQEDREFEVWKRVVHNKTENPEEKDG